MIFAPSFIHATLVYEDSLLDHVAMPIVPQPNSLLQYNGVIFIVKGTILNLDDKCWDVHVDTLDDITVPVPSLIAKVSLN